MRIFKISDSASNKEGIDYLAYTLKDVISDVKGECKRFDDEYRSGIKISVTRGYADYIRSEIEDKIADVIGYIPTAFTSGQMMDFVRYLIGEKRGKKAIVENGKVYDGNYNLLQRTFLLPKSDEGKIVKEVILSASGRIETDSIIPEADKRYLRDFYGNRMYEK